MARCLRRGFAPAQLLPRPECYASDAAAGRSKVAFFLPLFDRADPPGTSDGGELELFSPSGAESRALAPEWNSIVLFAVSAGASMHAIREVRAEDKPILYLSGWFHAPGGVPAATAAAPAALQPAPLALFSVPLAPLPELSQEDLALLSRWVAPEYLAPARLAASRASFEDTSAVVLPAFLKPEVAKRCGARPRLLGASPVREACAVSEGTPHLFGRRVRDAMVAADARDKIGKGNRAPVAAGVGGGWVLEGPPEAQRFLRYSVGGGEATEVGAVLAELQSELLASPACGRLLASLAGTTLLSRAVSVRRFRSAPSRALSGSTPCPATAHRRA
jgi:hypothetical protein